MTGSRWCRCRTSGRSSSGWRRVSRQNGATGATEPVQSTQNERTHRRRILLGVDAVQLYADGAELQTHRHATVVDFRRPVAGRGELLLQQSHLLLLQQAVQAESTAALPHYLLLRLVQTTQ